MVPCFTSLLEDLIIEFQQSGPIDADLTSAAQIEAWSAIMKENTFVNRKKPEAAQIIEDVAQLEHSLEILKKMSIKTVYPGHGKPFLMSDYFQAR